MSVDRTLLARGVPHVLDGLVFPARRWQLIAQAQHYGATCDYTLALSRLPPRIYLGVEDVASQIVQPGHRWWQPAAVPPRRHPANPRTAGMERPEQRLSCGAGPSMPPRAGSRPRQGLSGRRA